MRVITRSVVEALKGEYNFKLDNTEVVNSWQETKMYLHWNLIAEYITNPFTKKELIEAIDFDFNNIELEKLTIEKLEEIETLDEWNKKKLDVICGGEWVDYWLEYLDSIDDCDLYEDMDFKDLAYQFVEDWLFGEVPDYLEKYLDYDRVASDLEYDYSEYNWDIYRLN